jgi:dTMP kinase
VENYFKLFLFKNYDNINYMKQNNYPGKFIVFEGLDGSGQSTQVSLMKEYLENKGFKVFMTKEPTKTSSAAQEIRDILDKKKEISAENLQKLFIKDRKEHLEKEILPALERGEMVVCDRYFFSTFAFGTAAGLDLKWLIQLNNDFLMPDAIFLLKVKPETCLNRITARGTEKTLFEVKEKMYKIWAVFEKLVSMFNNVFLIDGEKSIQEVFEDSKKVIFNKFKI